MKLTNSTVLVFTAMLFGACGEPDSLGKATTNVNDDPDATGGGAGSGATGATAGTGAAAGSGATAGNGGAAGTGAAAGTGGSEHDAAAGKAGTGAGATAGSGGSDGAGDGGDADPGCPPNRVWTTGCIECGLSGGCMRSETRCFIVCSSNEHCQGSGFGFCAQGICQQSGCI